MAKGSWATYQRAITSLDRFLQDFNIENTLPVSPISVALFVAHMHNLHFAPSTIETYISAIGYIHKLHGVADPANNFLVRKAILGAKKESAQPDIRLPITFPLLTKLVTALQHSAESLYERVLYTSMYLLAFAAFLRVGEMAVSNKNITNVLKLGDVKILEETGKIQIIFRNYKHSKGKQTVLEVGQKSVMCPVQALRHYLEARGAQPGSLYVWPSGKTVTRDEFCKNLRVALNFCGLDPSVYTSHSFRIGATCHAVSTGHTDAQIREMGRWHSDAFKRYVRL